MRVQITEYADLARTDNGQVLPLGRYVIARQTLEADGDFDPLSTAARFVRIATDAAVEVGGQLYLPGVEFVAVEGGETLTLEEV